MPPPCEAANSTSFKYSNPLSRSWSPPARDTSGTPRAERGPTSYTAFYTRRAVLAAKRDELKRLVRALYRTQKWLHANPPEPLAEAAQSYFPGVAPQLMCAAVARYRTLGIWGHNPILPRRGYEQLRASLVSGGFVTQGAAFEQAVDNSLAEDVVREDPPPLTMPSGR